MAVLDDINGKMLIRKLGQDALEAWAADGEPDWWDVRTHTLLCSTGSGLIELTVPEVEGVAIVERDGIATPMARIFGCYGPSSADTYWVRIPVIVLENA